MKQLFKAFTNFIKEYYFCLFAALALILPDLQLRYLVWPKAFAEAFVGPVAWLFSLAWISLIIFTCLIILPKKWGRIIYITINGLFIILSLCQYVYFGIFEQFFWLKSIALVGEGADYLDYAIDYIDLRLIVCTFFAVISLVLAAVLWKKPPVVRKTWWLVAILPILAIAALHVFMQPELFGDSQDDWDSWRKPRVVYKQFTDVNKSYDVSGLYHLTFRDLFRTVFPVNEYSEDAFSKVDNYFSKKTDATENEYTGIFKGKNVIAVMLEGIDTWMINEKYTPAMCYMMKNGLNFTNYYAPTFGTGHTFNSEFAFNTGYFNPVTAVSATNFSANRFPYSLAHLFKNSGYSANSFHYNDPAFYNRGIMHNSLGFDKYNSFPDFGMPETVSQADSNILSNDAIYAKMLESQPFYDFVITYSGHVPYTFDDAKLSLAKQNHPDLIDSKMNAEKNNCLILAADTDDFFKQLLTRLNHDGILENTVIVGFTDHYAYGFSDEKLLKEYKNGEILYRVPAFIYSPGIKAEEISKPMMTVDFLPTLVNLMGLDAPDCFIGNDILCPENNGFVYFGNSAWLDNKMYYTPSGEQPAAEDMEHIRIQNKRVAESFEINDIVISGDYFAHR